MADNHTPLQPADTERLDKARKWIKGHFSTDRDAKYESVDHILRVISVILESGWVQKHQTSKLQCLGVAFGDAIAQKLMLDWVVVEDEYGRDCSLNWPGTTIYVHPITMISKRIEVGENVDVCELFDQICDRVTELALSGRRC